MWIIWESYVYTIIWESYVANHMRIIWSYICESYEVIYIWFSYERSCIWESYEYSDNNHMRIIWNWSYENHMKQCSLICPCYTQVKFIRMFWLWSYENHMKRWSYENHMKQCSLIFPCYTEVKLQFQLYISKDEFKCTLIQKNLLVVCKVLLCLPYPPPPFLLKKNLSQYFSVIMHFPDKIDKE